MADGGEAILRVEKSAPAASKMIVVPAGTMSPGTTPKAVTLASEQSYRDRLAWDRYTDQKFTIGIAAIFAILAAALLAAAFTHRRRIARAADNATVSILAAGVKAKRAVGEKAGAYRQRIIDRADGA